MTQQSRVRSFFLITALILIWGVSWPIYKAALSYTPPLLFAGMRTLLGGLALALIALPAWRKLRFRKHAKIYVIAAFLNVFLFFGLQTVGLTYMPGGLFSVIIFIQPVMVGLMAWLWLGESMSIVKISGFILGFAGVLTASAYSLALSVSWTGVILALLTALSWAFGAIFMKKEGGSVDPLWLIAIQSMMGGVVLTALGFTFESFSSIIWSGPYISGLLFGMFLGVPTAWVLYFILIRSGEASKVATSTFLVPVISVLISSIVLDEPFHLSLLAGLVMVAASIYLVNSRFSAPAPKLYSSHGTGAGH